MFCKTSAGPCGVSAVCTKSRPHRTFSTKYVSLSETNFSPGCFHFHVSSWRKTHENYSDRPQLSPVWDHFLSRGLSHTELARRKRGRPCQATIGGALCHTKSLAKGFEFWIINSKTINAPACSATIHIPDTVFPLHTLIVLHNILIYMLQHTHSATYIISWWNCRERVTSYGVSVYDSPLAGFIFRDSKFDFVSGASTEQQADDPFMIFEGFILRGFPL